MRSFELGQLVGRLSGLPWNSHAFQNPASGILGQGFCPTLKSAKVAKWIKSRLFGHERIKFYRKIHHLDQR